MYFSQFSILWDLCGKSLQKETLYLLNFQNESDICFSTLATKMLMVIVQNSMLVSKPVTNPMLLTPTTSKHIICTPHYDLEKK